MEGYDGDVYREGDAGGDCEARGGEVGTLMYRDAATAGEVGGGVA